MANSHFYWYCFWNFNHKVSYLPDVICNIVVKAHFGRASFQMQHSTQSDIPPPKFVRRIEQDEMWDEVHQISSQLYPPTCQMKWPRSDVRGSTQQCLSDIPPSPNIQFSALAISHCYWHLVVMNGNFTLLLPSSGQECQFNGSFTFLLPSSGQERQFHMATDI